MQTNRPSLFEDASNFDLKVVNLWQRWFFFRGSDEDWNDSNYADLLKPICLHLSGSRSKVFFAFVWFTRSQVLPTFSFLIYWKSWRDIETKESKMSFKAWRDVYSMLIHFLILLFVELFGPHRIVRRIFRKITL